MCIAYQHYQWCIRKSRRSSPRITFLFRVFFSFFRLARRSWLGFHFFWRVAAQQYTIRRFVPCVACLARLAVYYSKLLCMYAI